MDIDTYLDTIPNSVADTINIIGTVPALLKQESILRFLTTPSEQDMLNDSVFYPRILVGTSGCIGAGLDSKDITTVIRIGISPSIIHFVQELGRCGRTTDTNRHDFFQVIFNVDNFVYMLEHIYKLEEDNNDSNTVLPAHQGFGFRSFCKCDHIWIPLVVPLRISDHEIRNCRS